MMFESVGYFTDTINVDDDIADVSKHRLTMCDAYSLTLAYSVRPTGFQF